MMKLSQVHNCVLCNDRDGRSMNLGSGLWDIKYHYAVSVMITKNFHFHISCEERFSMEDILNDRNLFQVCYYNKGALFELVDPGPENKADRGVVDEVLRFSKKSQSIPNFVNR